MEYLKEQRNKIVFFYGEFLILFMYVEGRVWSRGGGGGEEGRQKLTIYNNNVWVTKFKFTGFMDLRVVGIRDY